MLHSRTRRRVQARLKGGCWSVFGRLTLSVFRVTRVVILVVLLFVIVASKPMARPGKGGDGLDYPVGWLETATEYFQRGVSECITVDVVVDRLTLSVFRVIRVFLLVTLLFVLVANQPHS